MSTAERCRDGVCSRVFEAAGESRRCSRLERALSCAGECEGVYLSAMTEKESGFEMGDKPPQEERVEPCWNLFSIAASFVGLVLGVFIFLYGAVTHADRKSLLVELAVSGAAVCFAGFCCGVLAAVRKEKWWAVTGLGILVNGAVLAYLSGVLLFD